MGSRWSTRVLFLCPSIIKIDRTSSWGTAHLYYQPINVLQALEHLLKAENELKEIDTYRYDVVDVTRQVLADYGKYIHKCIADAYYEKIQKSLIFTPQNFFK